MSNTRLAVGDRIRIGFRTSGTMDFTVEEFRQCLGVFYSENHREAGHFTPLCELYGPGPDTKQEYISNHGPYDTNEVPVWMNLPRLEETEHRKIVT